MNSTPSEFILFDSNLFYSIHSWLTHPKHTTIINSARFIQHLHPTSQFSTKHSIPVTSLSDVTQWRHSTLSHFNYTFNSTLTLLDYQWRHSNEICSLSQNYYQTYQNLLKLKLQFTQLVVINKCMYSIYQYFVVQTYFMLILITCML